MTYEPWLDEFPLRPSTMLAHWLLQTLGPTLQFRLCLCTYCRNIQKHGSSHGSSCFMQVPRDRLISYIFSCVSYIAIRWYVYYITGFSQSMPRMPLALQKTPISSYSYATHLIDTGMNFAVLGIQGFLAFWIVCWESTWTIPMNHSLPFGIQELLTIWNLGYIHSSSPRRREILNRCLGLLVALAP